MNIIDLVNRSLSAIGCDGIAVTSVDDDLFELGLNSIERITFLAKVEELSNCSLEIGALGTAPMLTVRQLASSLS